MCRWFASYDLTPVRIGHALFLPGRSVSEPRATPGARHELNRTIVPAAQHVLRASTGTRRSGAEGPTPRRSCRDPRCSAVVGETGSWETFDDCQELLQHLYSEDQYDACEYWYSGRANRLASTC